MGESLEKQQSYHNPDMSFRLGFILLSAIFLVFPYWNGLFFHPSFAYSAIYLFSILIILSIWWSTKKIQVAGWSLVDYFAVGITLAYLLAAISPANYEHATIGIIRSLAYLGSYVLVRILLAGGISRVSFLRVFAASGILVSLYGFATGFGLIERAGAIYDPSGSRRLSSVFEYPNTAASYVVVIYILTIGLLTVSTRRLEKFVYSAGLFMMLAFIFHTQSRGALLVLTGLAGLIVLIAPKGGKFTSVGYTILPALPLLFAADWLGDAIKSQNQIIGWAVLLLASVITGAFSAIFDLIRKRVHVEIYKTVRWIIIGLILLAVMLGVAFVSNSLLTKLYSMFEQSSLVQRFVFYKDAFAAFLENPIFGNGFQTWKETYQSFQSYPYVSRQAHGYWVDIVLDTGIVGAIIWLGFITVCFREMVSSWKNIAIEERRITFFLVLGIVGLIGHSFIDFDMAYGTMNYLLWTLMGLAIGPLAVKSQGTIGQILSRSTKTDKLWIVVPILSLICLVSITGYAISEQILKKISIGGINPEEGLKQAETGIVLAPYRSGLWMAKAKFLNDTLAVNSSDKAKSTKVIEAASKAVSMSPFDTNTSILGASYLAKHGEGLKALELFRQAWKNGKYNSQATDLYIINSKNVGAQLYDKNKNQAKRHFENGWLAYQDAVNKIQKFESLPKVLRIEFSYDLSPASRLAAAESAFYLGKYEQISGILAPIVTSNDKKNEAIIEQSKLLLNAVNQKKGQPINETEVKDLSGKKKELEKYYQSLIKVEPLVK
ncbi:O-antigen ligase family protein [Effusibacillus lacus]|uniref:O-antigen ligase-related domain-containing protein n=1 Tax=Effusibacillus lacus TaxID=1348429 RepID=A0A292YU88_9BACL|nr:O-antigen ligase family protein [Effusibacillus lacus]TCS73720.1 O-antigen ligase [Effusibacillus lacus]GAX92065.1 hypothetical protein EFBL_3756 [Effusibacillus lacus]